MLFKELRKKNGYKTQSSLAKELNVEQSTIANWETGLRKPRIDMLSKIAEALNVSTDEVLRCFE